MLIKISIWCKIFKSKRGFNLTKNLYQPKLFKNKSIEFLKNLLLNFKCFLERINKLSEKINLKILIKDYESFLDDI